MSPVRNHALDRWARADEVRTKVCVNVNRRYRPRRPEMRECVVCGGTFELHAHDSLTCGAFRGLTPHDVAMLRRAR